MGYAKIRTEAVILNPVTPISVPTNSLFSDSFDGNTVKVKDFFGNNISLKSSDSLFRKQMEAAAPITAGMPVSKRPDGRIVPTDRDDVSARSPIGFALEEGETGDLIAVFLAGPNLPGVLAGRGFLPGQQIFSDNIPGGMVAGLGNVNVLNESILRLGIADCAAGVASGEAVDLILNIEVVSTY